MIVEDRVLATVAPENPALPSRRPRVAFVVQRCGAEVNGGAELHCRLIAERMLGQWDVEILTTCALDYMTWENHFAPGVETLGELPIRRFPVDRPRDVAAFNTLSAAIHGSTVPLTVPQQEEWMRAQGPNSTDLLRYIENHRDTYDLFVFFGYLYAQTYFGLPIVARKSVLLPLAHDEWTIHLPMWDRFFGQPARYIFNSQEELAFLRRRFPQTQLDGKIVGIGLEPRQGSDGWRFRERFNVFQPYLLYVGRIDPSKGCATMFEWFLKAKRTTTLPHKLVLIGKPVMHVPDHPDIISTGFVEEQVKNDAMAGCDWLLMPSQFESLSFVILETWLTGRPVIVNGNCDVLEGHCRRSRAGLSVRTYAQWLASILTASEAEKDAMGDVGRAYVEQNYAWSHVEAEYRRVLDQVTDDQRRQIRIVAQK